MHHEVEFEAVERFVRVPVRVGHQDARFLVDSGIGVTIISSALAQSAGAEKISETFSGRRMSGQEVTVPLVGLPEVRLGGYVLRDHAAGVIDLGPTGDESSFDGILGLDCFPDACVTVDPGRHRLTVTDATPQDGVVVPVDVRWDGPAVTMFARLELPSGRVVTVEVDTGSAALILDERLMPECDVAIGDEQIDERRGVDETGNPYTRRFITIDGSVQLVGESRTTQPAPRVMFQKIIYDGLLGSDFLNRFRYSFDVRGKRLVLESLDADPQT